MTEIYKAGKEYEVDCVIDADGTWIPVIGIEHDDDENCLKSDATHVHIDWRFMKELPSDPATMMVMRADLQKKRLKLPCYRAEAPKFSFALAILSLLRRYKSHKLKCFICPHKGTPLGTVKPDAKGIIRCPAHGLPWNLTTAQVAYTGAFSLRVPGFPQSRGECGQELPFKVRIKGLPQSGARVKRLELIHDESGDVVSEIALNEAISVFDGDVLQVSHKDCKLSDLQEHD